MGLSRGYFDADELGASKFSVYRLVLIYSRYNLSEDLRSGPQVQVIEGIRSGGISIFLEPIRK